MYGAYGMSYDIYIVYIYYSRMLHIYESYCITLLQLDFFKFNIMLLKSILVHVCYD